MLFFLLKKWIYIWIFIALLVLGVFILPKNLGSAGVELWRTASVFARSDAAVQAATIFLDHPVFGIGFDTYRYAQKQYRFAAGKNWEVSHSGGGTDSSILFVLVTTGVVGLVAYGYLWTQIIRRMYMLYNTDKKSRVLSIIILASICAMFVNSLFINSLFYPYVMFWLWSLLGLVELHYEKR